MKIKDIEVGMIVKTRISGDLVRVRVERVVEKKQYGYGRRPDKTVKRVVVSRVDNGKVLPKARSASALHSLEA